MSVSCWSCREPVQGAVCQGCGAVQPPPREPDLFAILGLSRRYHLDEATVDVAWRQRSRAVHPDRHVSASAVERRMSLQWTALLNEARRVLRDPFRRASWLATGVASPVEAGGAPLSDDLLEKVFAWRMAIDEDATDPEAAVAVREAWDDAWARMDRLFVDWEEGRGDLEEVPACLSELRALEKLVALL
jgi:molecular chaperone HscB